MPDYCSTDPEADSASTAPEIVVITGMSGAGRSEAMHTFEDLGYFCIDNLPPSFIGQLVDLAELPDSNLKRLAVVCDVRGHAFFDELAGEMAKLTERKLNLRVLFLEADDEVLLRRFKETRRRHPMCDDGRGLSEGIAAERAALEPLRQLATVIIDSSELRPNELHTVIRERFAEADSTGMAISVNSFGFKHSVPNDADIVMDVRFLPNPHYDPALRPLSGLDAPVVDFVMSRPETEAFLDKWLALLDAVVPSYVAEGKHHLSIAMGCTGGRHRSVALAEATARHLVDAGYQVTTSHRDIGRDRAE